MLYEIVEKAQSSPIVEDLPLHALFSAYEEILSSHGISSAHDQVYLRFIFKLGERERGKTSPTLYDAFEALLAERDIVVEYGSEAPDEETVATDTHEQTEETTGGSADGSFLRGRGRQRRASFSSFIETEEVTRTRERRPTSAASVSRLQGHSQGFGSTPFKLANPRPKENDRRLFAPSSPETSTHLLRRLDLLRLPGKTRPTYQHPKPTASVEAHNLPRPLEGRDWRDLQPRTNRQLRRPSFSIYEDSLPEGSRHDLGSSGYQELSYRPSDTQLLRDADTFHQFHIRTVSRNVLRQWRARVDADRQRHANMWLLAVLFDKATLLRQALERWQDLARLRWAATAHEAHQRDLEAQAHEARSLYLLSKAFTHWAQSAADEAERGKLAQRHILRLRYYNVWKEYTIVNELKVRKQLLKKAFGTWKARLGRTAVSNDQALVLHKGNVVEKAYRRWFWNVCERRIDEWRTARLKRLHLVRWAVRLHKVLTAAVQLSSLRRIEIRRRCFVAWSQKAEVSQFKQRQADAYYQHQIVARCLPQWQRGLRLAPAARQVQGMVQRRIASSVFSTLLLRRQLAQQAELVDRRRVLRNAWTQWNDRLRWQTMLRQVDDRLATQALYRWVVAERLKLMQRLRDERIRVQAFNVVLQRWQDIHSRAEEGRRAVEKPRAQRLLRTTLAKWSNKLRQQRDQETKAQTRHTSRLQRQTVQSWHAQHERRMQLDRWCVEAIFYFRATRTLKTLQAAVKESRKEKRRAAYAQVRRRVKMDLARKALHRWRERKSSALALRESASTFIDNRQVQLAADILEHWRDSFERLQEHNRAAISRDQRKLITGALRQWSRRCSDLQQDAQAAHDFAHSHTEKAAYDCLRRFQLCMLEHRSLAAKARTVSSWYERRRVRALMLGWANRAVAKRKGEPPPPLPLPPPRASSPNDRRTSRARASAAPRDSLFASPRGNILATLSPPHPPASPPPTDSSLPTNQSPPAELAPFAPSPHPAAPLSLPGFLHTPSRRAARARTFLPFGESLAASGADERPESFTPATGGFRNLRRSLLGHGVRFTAQATGGDRSDFGQQEGLNESDDFQGGVEETARGRLAGQSFSEIPARDGVRRSLFLGSPSGPSRG